MVQNGMFLTTAGLPVLTVLLDEQQEDEGLLC